MHETSEAVLVLEQALKLTEKEKKVTGHFIVKIGELRGITVQEVKTAVNHLINDNNKFSNLKDFEFSFADSESIIECNCGYKGKPEIISKTHGSVLFICNNCSMPSPKVRQGSEITVILDEN